MAEHRPLVLVNNQMQQIPVGDTFESDLLNSSSYYDLEMSYTGTPDTTEIMGFKVIARDVTIPANFTGSQGYVRINPDAVFNVDIRLNNVSIGNAAIQTNGTFTFTTVDGTPKSLVIGDVLSFRSPSGVPIEETIEDIAITILGSLT